MPSQLFSSVNTKNGLFFPRYGAVKDRITLRGIACRGINDHCT